MPEPDCDVAIIGGGLAGLTLSLQLRKAAPDLSVTVLERMKLPPPIASHKVGESTVELGAHYLSNTLGLGDLLDQTQIRKFGLRLFFGAGLQNDLADADEFGASRLLPATSYQIDRGKFEGDLADIAAANGVSVQDESLVRDITIGTAGNSHRIECERDGERRAIRCRWIVDAGSRTATLKRKLGISKPSEHNVASAWLRLDTAISVDEWSSSDGWRQRCQKPRRLSTNHLMGPGYWVWIIPLKGDRTSIGIVSDAQTHPASSFNSFQRFCDWLSRHQPRLADEILAARDTLMDFRFMSHLARDSEQVWSQQRWAMTGEAGLFSDPFYSPGSDFIGISNTFICDMIGREQSGKQFALHANLYQHLYRSFFESTMSLYERQYLGFGDTRLMVVKTTWDTAYYYAVLTWLFVRNVMTDIEFIRRIQPQLLRALEINGVMQDAFRRRASEQQQDVGHGRFFDMAEIPILYDLNSALLNHAASLTQELTDNCGKLEKLAPTLLNLLENESASGSCALLGDLRQRFN